MDVVVEEGVVEKEEECILPHLVHVFLQEQEL